MENKKTSTLQPDIDSIAFTLDRRSKQKPILIEVAETDAIKQISHLSDNDLQSVEVNLNKENFPERERSSGVENFELEQENKVNEEENLATSEKLLTGPPFKIEKSTKTVQ